MHIHTFEIKEISEGKVIFTEIFVEANEDEMQDKLNDLALQSYKPTFEGSVIELRYNGAFGYINK